MHHFYIDTKDGYFPIRDDVGQDLPNREAARRLAMVALREMARDAMPDGDQREFIASVRDDGGHTIYSATLSLSGGCRD